MLPAAAKRQSVAAALPLLAGIGDLLRRWSTASSAVTFSAVCAELSTAPRPSHRHVAWWPSNRIVATNTMVGLGLCTFYPSVRAARPGQALDPSVWAPASSVPARTPRVAHDGPGSLRRRRRRTRTSVVAIAARAIPPTRRKSPTPVPARQSLTGSSCVSAQIMSRALAPAHSAPSAPTESPSTVGGSRRPPRTPPSRSCPRPCRAASSGRWSYRSRVDQPAVLVERRMGDPQRAFAHAGNLVPHHEAAGRERRRARRASSRRAGRAPHWVRGGSDPAGCRLRSGRVGSASSAQLLCA